MIRRPPRSPLFPSAPLSRSLGLAIFALGSLLAGPGPARDSGRVFVQVATAAGLVIAAAGLARRDEPLLRDRKSTRLNSSHANISYAVFCLKKKKKPFALTRS